MSSVFLRLLNISITAGWIVLVVVLLRFVLKKAPKWIRVVLWGLVALRLLLPVSIESVTSLVPSAETVKIESVTAPVLTSVNEYNGVSYFYKNVRGEQIVLQSGFPTLNSAVNPTPEEAAEHFDTVAVLKTVAGWVWLIGVVGMLFYALISFLRLKHRVRASVLLEKGVYVCDEIKDPFILGLLFPKIYLPSGMDEQTRAYVLSHECAHLKRFDHIWKPLGFLLLSVYWFNPLLWLAYILLCRDIELACDEKVVKELDDKGKAAYSEALVTASVSRRSIAACPLAFGEVGVKSRVKSVLNYKKPAFWIILVAILACIAVAVCFLTMPKKDATITELSEEIQKINGTLPGNTFLYLYRDNTSYFCYSLNGENGCGTSDAYYDKPFDLFAEIRQGIITVDHDSAHIKEITRFIHDTSIGFIQNTITGSKQYSSGLFEQVLPLYTQDWHKCREIKLKENDADFPVSKGSSAYYTLNENGFELCYYGHSDKGNDNVSSMLLYIEVPDLEAVIERFAPSAASDKTPIPTASFDSITGSDAENMQWLDYYSASNQMPWEETKEIAVDAFPNTRFRWTSGSVEAIENGKTRTLFTGMPVWNVFFTDVTGDGKPELCATVSFGSGIVDDHIVVYDYMNRQSYTLWDRGTFDYHLYTENGALLVGKTLCNSYSSDTSILDTGTLMMHDGVLCCRWSDGSFTPLNIELHESELYGEWLVEKETDNGGNELYAFGTLTPWKEYNFKEDGTVIYNETVPYSSDSELAFGHPVDYRYAVYDNYVHILDGRSCTGYYDAQTQTLRVNYQPSPGQYVYATLRRMGEDASVAEKTYVGEWELVKIVDGRQEYDLAFLTAASGLENNRVVLRADGTGNYLLEVTGSESEDIGLTYTAADDENTVTVRFAEEMAYGYTMIAKYDPDSDTLSMYYPDDPTMYSVYCRAGSIQDDPAAELTIEMLVGKWVTEGNIMYDPPFLPGTLTFLEDGSASLWLDGYLRSGEALDFQTALTGNMVYFSGYLSGNTFASYDAKTDTLQLRLPLASAGTLVFTRDRSADAPQTLEEILLGTYVCTGAKQNELNIPVPAEYVGMTIDLGDTSGAESYRHVASVTVGGTKKEGYDWKADENDILIVWNPETGDNLQFEWFPKQTACTTLKLTIGQENPITLFFTFDD